ncbi:YDG domain-containing protein [Dyella acidiphila]|uniref:Filamentous hemagglutinin N-terminal domain-containing protein n=1 Tax=Dyella acidiphila TaxID=2775866 RepID=A0ABR9G9I4_9GAMM|nr:YDG domain-containing protein [Dyella acidiphila]MBE1160700.1 filamentous hemagglutinin N-terminal domain-containing protein [Dyella acidiphila]
MNHIYRLCWNRSLSQWVPASELATATRAGAGPRKRGVTGQRVMALSLLAMSLGAPSLAHAGGPSGGQIVSGAGQIQQVGNVTTIRQDSSTLMLNWQNFNVGANQTVDFLQPGSSSIAVNRIYSSTPSEIDGHLNANGQVWLINPNGVLFGQGAQVNVGGLVASTLDVDDSTIDSSERRFSGSGKGSVINRGTITAANGGYVALLGNQVSNQGTITAQLGTVALAGGSTVTLTFSGNQLVHLQVDQSTLNNLAENRQLIVADGGRVIMTAGAKDALLASVVNNTGVVQAQTVQNHNGTITLLGGMTAGQVNVGGTLDASAPHGGAGGSIETSAANFQLAADAHITAAAPHGAAGTWLVDPTDLTIDSTAATTISNTLNAGTNVTEQTTSSGATGVGTQSSGLGDINIDAAVSWSNAAATLKLEAYHGINVNAPVTGAGGVVMTAAGGNLTIANGASILGGTGVTLSTGANFVNNGGAAAVSTGTSAPWLIYSTNPTLDTTGGLTPNFIQYNAPYQTAAATSGNGFLYSVAPTLTVTGLTSTVAKTYDGTTTAVLAGSNLADSGLINGDTVASASGTYASANAGSNISVTTPGSISGYAITNAAGIPVYGYALSGAASAAIGTINKAALSAIIINDPTKVYDGTTTATLSSSNYQLSGFVAGQGATVNQPSSIAYAGADAGQQQLNATFTLTNFVANSGTNLSNYLLPTTATGIGTITRAPVLLSGVLATSKVYDGGTADTLDLSNASIYGVIAGDSITLDTSGAAGSFASANAGNGITVNLSGFVLAGSKINDYTLVAPTNLTANITPKALTVSGITANDKIYDSTTADTLNTGGATLNGVVGNDVVSLQTGSASGTFSQSDVGNSLAVTANGLNLAGAAAGNYTLTAPIGLTANITPRPLTVAFNGSPDKIYDGSDFATLTQGDFTITGFAGSDGAVVSQSPAVYASPNAGSNIGLTATLQPSDFTVTGTTKLSNYTFNSSVSGTGTIDPAPLFVSIVNNPTKVYDGSTTATFDAGNFVLSGVIGGENITFNAPATGDYASPNASIEAVSALLSASNFTAGSGTLLSNYALPTLASGFGTITQAPLSGSLIASLTKSITKIYDGNDEYLLNVGGEQDFVLSGFKDGDTAVVNPNITGFFASKNVANNQPFQVTLNSTDFTFTCGGTGSCAGNYSYPSTIFTTGSITPAQLTVSLVGNLDKVYDGTTVAQLNSSNFQVNGFVSGEGGTVTPTAGFNYSTANAGNTILISGTLTANNYTAASGTLLSNYTLATAATGFGNIAQAPLFITGVYATGKVYDTTANDTLNVGAAGLSGLVASDVGNVTLTTSTTGTFAQSNVGNGIGVTASGFSISGSASANYNLQVIKGLTADITPAPLTLTGITAASKVYDGTLNDTLNVGSAVLHGVLGTDNVTLDTGSAAGTFSTINVGNNLAVTSSGFGLDGTQAGNYVLAQPGGLKANITPATLVAVITGSPTKVYDGTNSATLTASDYTLTGFVSGEGASIPQSATANYTTPNAGTGLGVQSTLVVSDFVANTGTLLSNYILPTSATGNNGVITPYVLNLSGTRVYDTTTTAQGTLFGTVTGLNGDTFTLSGQGTTSSKNVGTYNGTGASSGSQPFNLNTLSLTAAGATGSGPDLASNYTLIGGTDTFVITPAVLTITGTTVNTKVYDGTTTATLGGTQQLQGVLGSDVVGVTGDTGAFASPNAGSNIAVSSSITIGGPDAGNYILTQPTGLTGTITQALITLAGTRQYDATTNANASAFGNSGVISTGIDGQTLTVTGAGLISAPDVNTYTQSGGTFNVGSLALSNGSGLASNYTLSTSNTFAVTPRVISLTGTRQYDTTTTADSSLFAVSGVNGETLTLTGSGTVSSKNVGTYKGTGASSGSQPFDLNTLALGNGTGNASNYTLIGGTDQLTITKAPLSITGTTVDSKTYDGNTSATLGGSQQLVGVLGSDNVTINADVGNFASPNAGSNIAVTAAITLSGTDQGNYSLTQPTGLTGTINAAPIVISGTRQYDANIDAFSSAFGNDGTIATGVNGETLKVSGLGTTFGADVGTYTGATFNLGTLALNNGSGLASNYTLTGANFAITPYVLTLNGTRVYDTSTGANANLFGSAGVLTGVNGETVNLSGSGVLNSKNAGAESFANLGSLSLSNGSGQASNYMLAGGTVTVTPYVLSLGGQRAYDGTNIAQALLFGSNGVLTGLNGETVVLSGSGTVASANANVTYLGVGSTTPTGQNFNLNTLTLGNGSGLAGNYTLIGGNDALTINQAVINLAGTRQYDAGIDASAAAFGNNGLINTGINGETLQLTGAGTVAGANVGNYSGGNFIRGSLALTNGSGSADNYTLVGGSDSLAITPYVLSLSGTRAYDGTTGANANLFGSNGVLTGVNGETLTLGGAGKVSSANASGSPYAGIGSTTPGQAFDINTLSLTGNGAALASNYTLVGGTDQLTITPYVLSLSGSRTYDGTTAANAALFGAGGLLAGVNGETVVLSGAGTVASANANATYTGIGSGTPGQAFDLGALQLGNATGLASNYTLIGGNDALTINRLGINLNGSRQYDGSANANASLFGANGVINTGINGETLDVTGTGTVTSANVGNYTGGNFSAGTLALTDGSGSASNYTLVGGSLAITPHVLDLSGSRAYDGTTAADAILFGNNGVLTGVNGETLTLGGAGTVSSANASGTPYSGIGSATPGQAFDLNNLNLTGNGAALASNYTLIGGNDALTINRAVITLSGTRQYDGGVDANAGIFGSNGTINTGVNGETITLTGAGTVAGANVGNYTGGNFNTNGLGLTDGSGLASNYTLGGGNVAITPYVIGLTASRDYDGTTAANASLFGNNGTITGVNGETLTLSGAGTVASANANATYSGTGSATPGQAFDLNSLQLGNGSGQAGNYTLIGGADALTINRATINLSANRQYDGGTDANASLFGNNGVINTGVNGETLNVTGTGTVSSANVGNYSGGNFSNGTLALTDGSGTASNYTLVGGTLGITPYVLNLTGTRVYDGSTGADAGLFGNNGVLTGVNGETVTLSGAGVLSSKNVGQQLAFASNGLSGYVLTGNGAALGSNYTLTGGTDWVTITPLAITVGATGQNKVYDGNTTAGVNLGSSGVLAGDTVNFSDGGASFSSPNAGSNVSIGVTGIAASGADAGNYTFNTTASTSANITPYVLNLSGTRVYDGSTGADAGLFGNNGVLTGINGQTVTLSGSGVLTSKNVGTQQPFANTGSLVLGNGSGLAANYTLAGGADWVTITPLSIVVNATGTNRIYNGQVGDTVSLTSNGVLPGDVLSFTYGSATFGNPYVGNGKTVTVSGIAANGADAANYLITDPITTTDADITSAGFNGSGVQGSWLAQLDGGLQSMPIATPYGSTDMDTVGVYTGNQQLRHRPIERNRARTDFHSGLALRLQNGGVRLPTDASP